MKKSAGPGAPVWMVAVHVCTPVGAHGCVADNWRKLSKILGHVSMLVEGSNWLLYIVSQGMAKKVVSPSRGQR